MAEKIKEREVRTDIIEAAKKIRMIAAESPEMGNAVMDLIGEDTCQQIMRIVRFAEIEEGRKHRASQN